MERERKHREMMISIHLRVYRGLSKAHTSHSITRNTLLLPNLAKNHQPRHSPWLIRVHQLRPSVMLKNTPTKDPFFQTLLTIPTIGCTHFTLWRVLSSAMRSPWQKHEERKKDRKHENKNKSMKRGKMNFLPWKFCFWRKVEAKKSKKCSKNWKKNKRAKKDIYRTFFYNEAWLKKRREKQKKRREMAWCNGCPAAEMNDNWMRTDFTRSTTSRHAAMVKRAFLRARDPQRVWILK